MRGRPFTVSAADQFSIWYEVGSSVHQGCVLGPLPFLMFISDLRQVVKSQYLIYVVDLKLADNQRAGTNCRSTWMSMAAGRRHGSY